MRAMSGLVSGCGTGKLCGALTGGCCVLGMYAGVNSNEHTLEGNEGISNELRHLQCAKDALRFPKCEVSWWSGLRTSIKPNTAASIVAKSFRMTPN